MAATIDEENCPNCLAEDGICQILDARFSATECAYSCPRCGERFTRKELELIYGAAPIK